MNRFTKVRLPGEFGQGLVEYALILILVGVVVIVALTIFGERAEALFCKVVYPITKTVGDNAALAACETPYVECVIHSISGYNVNAEAVVTDNHGTDPGTVNARFYVDDDLIRTEVEFRYCLSSGNTCSGRNLSSYGSGTHTLRIEVEDADGYASSCEAPFLLP